MNCLNSEVKVGAATGAPLVIYSGLYAFRNDLAA